MLLQKNEDAADATVRGLLGKIGYGPVLGYAWATNVDFYMQDHWVTPNFKMEGAKNQWYMIVEDALCGMELLVTAFGINPQRFEPWYPCISGLSLRLSKFKWLEIH